MDYTVVVTGLLAYFKNKQTETRWQSFPLVIQYVASPEAE